MRKFAMGRRGALTIGVVATIAAASALLSRFTLPLTRCERCGKDMRPFRHTDMDWVGSNIYECRHCGFMVDQDAWSFAQRLWDDDLSLTSQPRS